jgi:hypothetical protein
MKVFLIIVMCFFLTSCSKKNEKIEERKTGEDTTVNRLKETNDTTKTPTVTDKEVSKKEDVKNVTPNNDSLLTFEQRQGKYIFVKYCAVCHGELGKSNGFNTYNLNPKPRNFSDSNFISSYSKERLAESIIKGGRGVNKSPLMPSYGGTLNKEEIEYVNKYVRFLSSQKQ